MPTKLKAFCIKIYFKPIYRIFEQKRRFQVKILLLHEFFNVKCFHIKKNDLLLKNFRKNI